MGRYSNERSMELTATIVKRADLTDLMVLEAYIKSDDFRRNTDKIVWPEDIIHQNTGFPFKVIQRAMERVESKGFIEYGVSLRSGWLSDKGKEFVRNHPESKFLVP